MMKQGQGSKRTRGRSNGRRGGNRQNMFDSNGPAVRIRGNAFQVHEKYLGLARDATSSGDRIAAENYYQHAEHYFRIHSADLEERNQRQNVNGQSSDGQRHAEGQRHSEGQRRQGGRDSRATGRNGANGANGDGATPVQNGNQPQAEMQPQTEIELPEPPAVEAAPPKTRRRKPAASKEPKRPATTNGGDTPAGD